MQDTDGLGIISPDFISFYCSDNKNIILLTKYERIIMQKLLWWWCATITALSQLSNRRGIVYLRRVLCLSLPAGTQNGHACLTWLFSVRSTERCAAAPDGTLYLCVWERQPGCNRQPNLWCGARLTPGSLSCYGPQHNRRLMFIYTHRNMHTCSEESLCITVVKLIAHNISTGLSTFLKVLTGLYFLEYLISLNHT